MVGLEIGLLLVAAQVAVTVEESRGLSDEQTTELLSAVVTHVVEANGATAAIYTRETPCTTEDRCAGEIRAKTGAPDILWLRVIGAPSTIRVVAERLSEGAAAPRSAEIDLERDSTFWAGALRLMAPQLFPEAVAKQAPPAAPEAKPRPEPSVALAPPIEPASPSMVPWLLTGGGAVAGAIAVYFGATSAKARSDGEPLDAGPRRDELESRAISSAIAADVLFGVAAVGIASGIVWLLTD